MGRGRAREGEEEEEDGEEADLGHPAHRSPTLFPATLQQQPYLFLNYIEFFEIHLEFIVMYCVS